jgi:hypothetical protein
MGITAGIEKIEFNTQKVLFIYLLIFAILGIRFGAVPLAAP